MASNSPWVWDDTSHRYRNTETGRYISNRQMLRLRDAYSDAMKGQADATTARLFSGEIDIQQWTLEMRKNVKDAYIDEYVLAYGGRNNMTQADWGRVGYMVRNQYGYLQGFAQDLAAGKLTEGQAQTRARMYIDSSTQAFERGKTEGAGLPTLPAYPGDGSTVCRANCKCSWEIEEADDSFECTWSLGAAEHCDDCLTNAARWNPLVVTKR